VRNYVAADDWVVGLFPALFEMRPFSWLNDLGSAGFFGFRPRDASSADENDYDGTTARVRNIGPIVGHHSAFPAVENRRLEEISGFLLAPEGAALPAAAGNGTRCCTLDFISRYLCWAVWLAGIVVIAWVGFYLSAGARQFALPVGAAYLAFVSWLLANI